MGIMDKIKSLFKENEDQIILPVRGRIIAQLEKLLT